MVEVDVFWSYGIGAGFAFASARQGRTQPLKAALQSSHFRDTLLFLACAFAPSGVVLLWGFPSWETMHLGTRDLPHWLVGLFAVTNVTQGLLGFFVTRWLVHRGWTYLAYLQWALGYFAMFFILVHGWDGSGYQRFFSADQADLSNWSWDTAARWLTSGVAHTLEAESPFIIPPILGLTAWWLKAGYQGATDVSRDDAEAMSKTVLASSVLLFSMVVLPACATLASVLVRELGWLFGAVAFALAAWVLLLRRGGVLHRHYQQLFFARRYFASRHATAPEPAQAGA